MTDTSKAGMKDAVREAWFKSPASQRQYATFADLTDAMKEVALEAGVGEADEVGSSQREVQ